MSEHPPPINMEVGNWDLKYYIFDWDNNILHMPTRIHLERRNPQGQWEPHAVSTAMFAIIRNDTDNFRPLGGDWENSFQEFRDLDSVRENTFLKDTREALQPIIEGTEKEAPSFHTFRTALREGRLFAIVTARGHNPQTIRAGVQYFIDHVLSDAEKAAMLSNLRGYMLHYNRQNPTCSDEQVLQYYLDLNKYHAVTSPHFQQLMDGHGRGAENPEAAKQFAIKDFVSHVIKIVKDAGIDKPVSFGFSDDDPANVSAVEKYILQRLAAEFPGVKFVVYDTSDPDIPDGRKMILQGQLELDLDR